MKSKVIFERNGHKWVVIGRDTNKKQEVIDTNEFIIINNDEAVLLDPGGIEIFPQVLTEITKFISTENIKAIFSSHQDPDIASSLALWHDLCDDLEVYCSWIWKGFLSHFGMGNELKLFDIPDKGSVVKIGNGIELSFVPAHYCHSSGNFSVYDPKANIVFSGDIGAALLPGSESDLFVKDFEDHIQYMEGFHKRWMPAQKPLQEWVGRIRHLKPDMICPQHGSIFKGENIEKFLNWLESLEVGVWEKGNEEEDITQADWMQWKK